MSETEFPVGHPEIRRGYNSCENVINKLKMKGEKFFGLCQVKILPPDGSFVPCLAHKLDGKVLFCL